MRRLLLAALLVPVVTLFAVPSVGAADEPTVPSAVLADAGYRPDVRPLASVLPVGVRIAGVNVGGLQVDTAVEFIRVSFAQPLVVMLGKRRIQASPSDLGAIAYARNAAQRALASSPGRKVDLAVNVPGAGVRRFVEGLADPYDRPAKPRRFVMRDFRPVLTAGAPGRRVDRSAAVAAIVRALVVHRRSPLRLPVRTVAPPLPPVPDTALIVIRRSSNALELFRGVKLVRRFGVATGQAAYPTPLGTFTVVTKQRDPWWYPPGSAWAKGQVAVPPGPGNPLGTRWMGLSAPLVGIHGTPDAASIGYSRSHGCIRMRIDQAEWLFDRVELGTRVMVVPA